MDLTAFFARNRAAALAFSGGVDSAYLLYESIRAGADVTAYFVKTEFQPQFELDDARRLAVQLGARLVVLEQSALSAPRVSQNPPDRCYHCKKAIFGSILARAAADGYSQVWDGTNASDDPSGRPGMKALTEMEVLSPLQLCGLTKAEIRRRSKAAGLFTWDKPAYACLATRVPTGTVITAPALEAVEAAEDFLFSQGFTDFRVRLTTEGCKLQLPTAQLPLALERREALLAVLEPLFGVVALDLKGR